MGMRKSLNQDAKLGLKMAGGWGENFIEESDGNKGRGSPGRIHRANNKFERDGHPGGSERH